MDRHAMSSRRKIALRVLAAIGLIALATYAAIRSRDRGNDFKYPFGAARLLAETGSLHVRAQPRYPITFHVLLAPLARLPIGVAATLWAVLSVAALVATPFALAKLSGIPPRRQVLAWLYAGPFFVDAIALGQADPIDFFLVTLGLIAVDRGRGILGAVLVGVAGLVKILPVVHWGTCFVRSRTWGEAARVVAGVFLVAALGFGLVAIAVGPMSAWDGFVEQARLISTREKPWHLVDRGGDLRANNESLPIVLARTFGAMDATRPREVVVLARLPLPWIWGAWFATVAVLGLGWLASIGPARRIPRARGTVGMFALGSTLMLATTPICWHHYFLWTLPAAIFLADRPRLIAGLAIASILGSAVPAARGLGVHATIAIGLFVVVARAIRREASSPVDPA